MRMRRTGPKWPHAHAKDLIARKILYIGDGYRAKNSEMGPKGLPFARAGNINGGFLFDDADLLDEANVPKVGDKLSRSADIVFTSKGTVGRFAFVRPETPKFVYSPQLCFWRILDTSILDPRFLLYWMQSSEFLDQVQQVKGLTDMADYVSLSDQRRMQLTVPPLSIQQRIASILCGYDDLIENNTRRIKILETIAEIIYREWFVNFRFPGHEKMQMVDSELGPIPSGWAIEPLEALVEEFIDYRGKTPKKLGADWSDKGVLALSALNVKQGRLVNLDKAKCVSEELYQRWMKSDLRAGDILMTSEAPLGELYFLPEARRYCLSQRVFSIRTKAALMQPSLLFLAMSSPEGQKQLKARASGTTVLGIRQADLRRIPILRPPVPLQQHGDTTLRPFLVLIDVLQRKTDTLRITRDFLLPKLISGEIPVEAADETAAELMEEIAQPA